jgi:signal transduction histidine kinase
LKVQRPLPAVVGNRLLLDHVFNNLISNALKFTPPSRKPEVHITAHAEERFAIVCVRDNGIGIAPEHQAKIFGLFQRLHTSDQYPGTGVGLAIVRRAADRLGGTISVESELGRGSTFCLRLPLATANA